MKKYNGEKHKGHLVLNLTLVPFLSVRFGTNLPPKQEKEKINKCTKKFSKEMIPTKIQALKQSWETF